MTNVLRLTEHPPLRRDQAFERLRDAIITGHFAPGARLIERELIGDIHQKLTDRISVSRVFAISLPGRLQQSARELAVVMDAIERRDAEGAAQSLMIYVRNAGEAALKHLDATSTAEQ